jgi:glycine hydroxymethyltransferase
MKDKKIKGFIEAELKRQKEGIELIPSENYVSKDILEAVGSILTNKYSEGYPKKRYYGGNEYIDEIELLAIKRAQKLFQTDYHVNVQPYSGSPANTAVYFALLEFGDTVMGMRLDMGGHITHGLPIGFSGRAYNFVAYGVDKETECIDYDEIARLAKEHKPKMIVCGATAYSRTIDFEKFAAIAKENNAILFADISHIAGLVAAGVHPSPFGLADVITTTTHKTLRGPRSAVIFCKEQYAKAIDRAVFPGLQGGPHDHVTAAKAICFKEAMKDEFKDYAAQIIKNAQTLAKSLSDRGYRVVTGGTDNHLLLVDLQKTGTSGLEAQETLDEVGITLNKNTIPYDPNPPARPSGIRLGTPAVTSRGMTEEDMKQVADFMDRALKNHNDKPTLKAIHKEVIAFASSFPLPGVDR